MLIDNNLIANFLTGKQVIQYVNYGM